MSVPGFTKPAKPTRNSAAVYQQRPIHPVELPGIMWKHIYTGCMGATYGTLVGGMFFITFGRLIGMNALGWGVYYAFIQIAVVGQLVSAYFTRSSGQRKKLWFRTAMAARSLQLVGVAAAFLLHPYSEPLAVAALIVLLLPASFCGSLSLPPWQSWLASIIPAEQHAWFMGRRGAWMALCALAVILPCGFLVDLAGGANKLTCLMAVFAVGHVLGFVDLWIHRTIPEPEIPTDRGVLFVQEMLAPLRDRRFRPFVLFAVAWNFAVMLGGSMSMPYILKDLQLEQNFRSSTILLVGVPLVLEVLISKRLGLWIDRVGTRRGLVFGHMMWGTIPVLWVLATPQTAYFFMSISTVLGAVGSRSAMLASDKIRSRSAPPEQTATYTASSTCLAAAAGALGAIAGGVLTQFVPPLGLQIAGKPLGGAEMVFLLSMALRLGSVALARRVREPAMADLLPAKAC